MFFLFCFKGTVKADLERSANSDVYLGYVGWAAGSFASTYELVETPTKNGNTWTDTSLVKACIAR